MKELFQAIYSRFSAEPHNDFYTAVGGRLAAHKARQGWGMPYAVYLLVSNVPEYTFTDTIENPVIQFSIFSDLESANEVTTIYGFLTALFDDCPLTISGGNHYLMERTFNQLITNEDFWHYIIEYRVMYE